MSWWTIDNVDDVASPALLVYPDRAEENLRRLIAVAGGADRLRPHMKTHKLPEIARMHAALGLTRVKCATIAEAEMLAAAGLTDVLLAYQPVGPAATRLLHLAQAYPEVTFRTIVDDEDAATALGRAFAGAGRAIDALVDLDVGMHRTGIAPSDAAALYRRLARMPGLTAGGLHAYDGHLRDPDLDTRCRQADDGFRAVRELADTLAAEGLPVPRIVAGGTPTLPCHARRTDPELELSPGTIVFWDAGYAAGLPDLDFQHAALVLTRVVSKPGGSRVCVDLGHKAVASEMPHPRVIFVRPPAFALRASARQAGLGTSAFAARTSTRQAGRGPSAAAIHAIVELQSAGTHDHADDAAGLKLHGDKLREQAETTGPIHEGPSDAVPELLATRFVAHSEEHLVFETRDHASLRVGDVLYGIPWHVCPTVALHGQAVVVREGCAVDRWAVTARERMLSV